MNERNIVAAILATGLLQGPAPQGASVPLGTGQAQIDVHAQHAVAVYQAVIRALASANLPSHSGLP
jgi:hypothetical protein